MAIAILDNIWQHNPGKGIGPEIVPLLTPPVEPFAQRPGIPPAQTLLRVLSGRLRQRGEVVLLVIRLENARKRQRGAFRTVQPEG